MADPRDTKEIAKQAWFREQGRDIRDTYIDNAARESWGKKISVDDKLAKLDEVSKNWANRPEPFKKIGAPHDEVVRFTRDVREVLANDGGAHETDFTQTEFDEANAPTDAEYAKLATARDVQSNVSAHVDPRNPASAQILSGIAEPGINIVSSPDKIVVQGDYTGDFTVGRDGNDLRIGVGSETGLNGGKGEDFRVQNAWDADNVYHGPDRLEFRTGKGSEEVSLREMLDVPAKKVASDLSPTDTEKKPDPKVEVPPPQQADIGQAAVVPAKLSI